MLLSVSDTGIGATGAIIRDAAGMFIAACSVMLARAIDATSAEAKTISVEGEPRSRRYLILSMLSKR